MTLLTSISNLAQTITIRCLIDGLPVEPISVSIDQGYDVVSAVATIVLPEVPGWVTFRQELKIYLGYDGFSIPVFIGFIEEDGRNYFPLDNTIKAAGYLKLSQYQYPTALAYPSKTVSYIINDLLGLAGIGNRDIAVDSTVLGTIEDITLASGTPTWSLINDIAQTFGYKVYDSPDGVVRSMLVSGVPATGGAFSYVQGTNIFSISRPRTISKIYNQVSVKGLPQPGVTWPTVRQEANSLVPNPPEFNDLPVWSQVIQTAAIASTVAERFMEEVNRVAEEIDLEVPGNPYLQPGMTIQITASNIGINSATSYRIRHVTHTVESDKYTSHVICDGGIGSSGYELGKPPVPVITYQISRETYEVGGTPTDMYTVICDGSASWDMDSAPSTLTFVWTNNKNADTATTVLYSTAFTQAQMDNATKPTVTLVVNDNDATSPSGTLTVTIQNTSDPITIRPLYVAAYGRAEATPNGGKTWNTWTPGGGVNVISTPEIGAEDHSYFGTDNAKLYRTDDYLATAPTLIHTFSDDVNCIYINRANANRVTVGLADGRVYRTLDADQLASSTWTLLCDQAAPINWIIESHYAFGTYRIAMSNQILVTNDDFATTSEIMNLGIGATAQRIALSFFANYGSGSGDLVKRDDGTQITFPVLVPVVSDVRGLTHDIADDILYAGDEDGRTFAKAAGATTFTQKATCPSTPGAINHMVRDGDILREAYIAADGGLYKTFDEFNSIQRVRDYTAAGISGMMVGYGDASLIDLGNGRVYLFCRDSGNNIVIVYTDNYLASYSHWQAVGLTGLPATSTVALYAVIDPFDKNTCMLVVRDVTAGSILYKTTNLGSSATWSSVFALADYNTLLGLSETSITIITPSYTIALQDFCGFGVVNPNHSTHFIHSHNNGSTFTGQLVYNYIAASTAYCIIGQHNPNRIYINIQYFSTVQRVFVNSDGGQGAFTACVVVGGSGGWGVRPICPYPNNPNDDIVYIFVDNGRVFKSVDVGVSATELGSYVLPQFSNSTIKDNPENAMHWFGLINAAGGGDQPLRQTLNDFATITETTVVGPNPTWAQTAIIRTGLYLMTNKVRKCYSSTDWASATERTGDLALLLANGQIECLIPDVDRFGFL